MWDFGDFIFVLTLELSIMLLYIILVFLGFGHLKSNIGFTENNDYFFSFSNCTK